MEQRLDGLDTRKAVLRILGYSGHAMRAKDIVSWPKENGQARRLNLNTVRKVLSHLKRTGEVAVVGHGLYASVTETGVDRPIGDEDAPDLTGLTGTDAVLRILMYTNRPMKHRDIVNWIEDHGQEPLTDGQIYGPFYYLSTKHPNVVERVGRGTYRVRKDWNGEWPSKPREQMSDQSQPKKVLGKEALSRVVIPCFGLYWERKSVSWSGGKSLLGVKTDAEDTDDPVNFADQTGVYILYHWPEVRYVGRTTTGNLYQRLSSHDREPKSHWDKFSWFGLVPVDEYGQLGEPHGSASIVDEALVMEGLLISVLTPPDNNKKGDWMGDEYAQVLDPEVEEREDRALARKLRRLLESRAAPQGR